MKASKVSADNKGGKTPRRQSDQGKSAVGRLGNALHGRRIGIGFRLFGAFGAVAFLTLVATGIAWLSFVNVGSVLHQVTDRSVPAMTEALRLAAASASLSAEAPALVAAGDDGERQVQTAELEIKVAAMAATRSEEHTSELQSLMRIPYATFCMTK